MNKRAIYWIVGLIVVGIIAYLSFGKSDSQDNQTSDKMIRVGISQITSHVAFDETVKGIKQGFKNAGYEEGKNIEFDVENAQGEASTNSSIAQKFANGNFDLIMPLGTQASQAVANLIKDKPIVFGAVTDPVSAGILKSKEQPGGNITGTSDITLYKEHLELLKKLKPDVKKIGIIYNPGEANSKFALQETQRIAQGLELEIITAPINNSSEILAAARSLVSKIDAFYMTVDNTVLSGQEALINVALESKKPLIALEQSGVEKGALATLGTSYEKVGERTAEMAIRVLKGEQPGSMPVLGVTDADFFVNIKTSQSIGLNIPNDLVSQAKQTY